MVAVELHPGRHAALRRLAEQEPLLTVVRADAADLRLPRRPFRVVSSPPYAVSTALLARLLGPGSRLESADLVLQRQLARRWAAGQAPGAGPVVAHLGGLARSLAAALGVPAASAGGLGGARNPRRR